VRQQAQRQAAILPLSPLSAAGADSSCQATMRAAACRIHLRTPAAAHPGVLAKMHMCAGWGITSSAPAVCACRCACSLPRMLRVLTCHTSKSKPLALLSSSLLYVRS
jgi:hypothetical protein